VYDRGTEVYQSPRATERPRSRRPVREPTIPYKPMRSRRGRNAGVAAIVVVIIIAIILLIPEIRNPIFQLFNPSGYREYPETIEFKLERHIQITNIVDYEVDIPKPKDFSSIQQVISVSATPTYSTIDKSGDEWMIWDYNGNADIKITYHMKTETVVWNFQSGDVLTLEEAKDTDHFYDNNYVPRHTNKEWKIDPTDPDVVALADELDNGGTIYDQLKSIFDYLVENFEYSTAGEGEVKAPSETIRDRNGDCDDMSFLFIAISRAMGIPAQVELGALYDQYNNQWVGHAWVAVYLPLKEGRSGLVNIDVVNREFLVRGANRFTDWRSDGDWTDNPSDENGMLDCTDFYCEWNLYDYYHMYQFNPISHVYLSDESTGIDYEGSGSVSVKLGGSQSIPGFEILLVVPVIFLAYIAIMLRKRNQKR